jgi:DNA-binding response OmpR family regulator
MFNKPLPILIVGDDEWEQLFFELLLRKQGFTTITAETGRQATDLASAAYFPVLIMDLFLPDMSSLEIIPALKALDPCPKVILVTSEIRDKYRQRAKEIGVDTYLTKPVDPEQLLAILHQYSLASETPGSPEEIPFDHSRYNLPINSSRILQPHIFSYLI